jgi:prepilin-type N-terminal cleavage/methylation domain-containing protein
MKNTLFLKTRPVWRPWPLYPVSKKHSILLGRQFRGFTLIELMVVVVIIAIISAVVVPTLISRVEKARSKQLQIAEKDVPHKAALAADATPQPEPPTVIPVTESADVNVRLVASNYVHRLKVYTLFDATFEGRFVFKNKSQQQERIKLFFPLPEGTTQARDVSLRFLDAAGNFVEPEEVTYNLKGIKWIGLLPREKSLEATVTYGAQGRDKYVYEGPGAGRAGEFKLVLSLEGATSEYIPAETLQPSKVESGRLMWDYSNLVTDRKIMVELPGTLSPIGRIILLSELAGLAVLLFGLGFLYLSDLKQPGRLDNFRWGDFLLLALNYFLFFVIFMILSLGGELKTWLSIVLSALLSIPLLMIHLTRILDKSFVFTRVLPLTIYTLAIVINGVYGAGLRKYIFLVLTVATIAFITFTYKKWSVKRKEHRKEQTRLIEAQKQQELELRKEKKLGKKRTEKRRNMKNKTTEAFRAAGRRWAEVEVLKDEANLLLGHEDKVEYQTIRQSIEKTLTELDDSQTGLKKINAGYADILKATDALEPVDTYSMINQELHRHMRSLETLVKMLHASMEDLKQLREEEKIIARKEDEMHYCIFCGAAGSPSPFCSQCGILNPLDLKCRRCGEVYRLPVHMIDREKIIEPIHCMICGEKHKNISYPLKPTIAPAPDDKAPGGND